MESWHCFESDDLGKECAWQQYATDDLVSANMEGHHYCRFEVFEIYHIVCEKLFTLYIIHISYLILYVFFCRLRITYCILSILYMIHFILFDILYYTFWQLVCWQVWKCITLMKRPSSRTCILHLSTVPETLPTSDSKALRNFANQSHGIEHSNDRAFQD